MSPTPMIGRMVLFGASGDLAARFLLPALAVLLEAGFLPDDFRLLGASREPWDDEAFRRHAAKALERHGADVAPRAREALVGALTYRQVDLADAHSVARSVEGAAPVAAYLALPPALFAPTVAHLAAAQLPEGSRIAIEKPFGEDLASAISLNQVLARSFGEGAERIVFRVDHVLGLATVGNLVGLRRGDRILDSVWSSAHIEEVQVLWEEDLALEGRAAYYDGAGALRDVVQNHMLQVLCLLAMDRPDPDDDGSLRDRKAEVLRALRPPRSAEPAAWTRRARYTAGRIGERQIPAYVEEEGVDPGRRTETFAEVALELDSERWRGTRFVLRAGRALGNCHREAVVTFRPSDRISSPDGPRNELRIGIEGPEDLALSLVGSKPGGQPRPIRLTGPPPSGLPAYGRVLLDLLEGGSALSVSGDAAEAAWRVMMPVLEAWEKDAVPLEEYPAGSSGPPPR